MALFNLARMTVSSSGTGTITLNAAVSGFLTFDQAGCSTAAVGQAVSYAINDTTQSEIGTGTYRSSSLSLTRGSSYSTNGNAAINMSNAAQVFITPRAADLALQINQYVTTVSTNFVTPANSTPTTIYYFRMIGGGGGSGGVSNVGTNTAGTGGGGSGAYAEGTFTGYAPGASIAITIGAGGAAGTNVGGNGGNGGATTIALTSNNVTCGGGIGSGGVNNAQSVGGAGGTVTAGTPLISLSGNSGMGASGLANYGGGNGAGSPFGSGGFGASPGTGGVGTNGVAYGTGGGGANNATAAGSSGAGGIVIINYNL